MLPVHVYLKLSKSRFEFSFIPVQNVLQERTPLQEGYFPHCTMHASYEVQKKSVRGWAAVLRRMDSHLAWGV